MTTIPLRLTPDETQRLAAEAAAAGAESVPQYAAGLLRARWERMEAEVSCATCKLEIACEDTEGPDGYCSFYCATDNTDAPPAQEQPREWPKRACDSLTCDMRSCPPTCPERRDGNSAPCAPAQAPATVHECTTCGELVPLGTCTCGPRQQLRPLPPQEPRVGVAVEEGEAGAVWLGNDDDGDGAAVYVCQTLHLAQIVPAWREEGQEGFTINTGSMYSTPHAPHLDGTQLRALAGVIADLRQCGWCEQWYRAGEICPRCGEERKA